ncbi:MAG: hypothetical protein ACI90V_001567 [Bacillariaceae sp.]|jgi:hypothetical protein
MHESDFLTSFMCNKLKNNFNYDTACVVLRAILSRIDKLFLYTSIEKFKIISKNIPFESTRIRSPRVVQIQVPLHRYDSFLRK